MVYICEDIDCRVSATLRKLRKKKNLELWNKNFWMAILCYKGYSLIASKTKILCDLDKCMSMERYVLLVMRNSDKLKNLR